MFDRLASWWRSHERDRSESFWPERKTHVTITASGLEVSTPGQELQRIAWADVRRILVETNASGPWGADVWWILESGESRCYFPQGATGENAAVAEMTRRFPRFEVKGMNSTKNATFVCWEADRAL